MSEFTDLYVDLLIKQYWEQTNAPAEISMQAGTWETIRDGLLQMFDALDIDLAVGDQQDLIGRIVGLSRSVPSVVAVFRFGFDDNPDSRTFDDRFAPVDVSAPFADRFEADFTTLQLDDEAYRSFLRAKIAKNNGSAIMVEDFRLSLQDIVRVAFVDQAYVIDNQDMSLSLYIDTTVELEYVRTVLSLDLLPRPQGVRYKEVIQSLAVGAFGFADDPDALGFADRFDAGVAGGIFAERIQV